MRRALAALPFALLALSPLGCAHDPLDDESGEQELNHPLADSEQPTKSQHRKERQTAEMSTEESDHEAMQARWDSEKDEFLRDKGETKDVKDGIRRRNELAGTSAGRHHDSAPQPKRHVEEKPASHGDDDAKPTHDDAPTNRGDVDPTESN